MTSLEVATAWAAGLYLLIGAVIVAVAWLQPGRSASPRQLLLGVLIWPVVLLNLIVS